MKVIGRTNLLIIIVPLSLILVFAGASCYGSTVDRSWGDPDNPTTAIQGYSDFLFGSSVTEVFNIPDEDALQDLMEFEHFGDGVTEYTRSGEFVTPPATLATHEKIYIREGVIEAVSIQIEFSRRSFLLMGFTEWTPDTNTAGEIRDMVLAKYSGDLVTHDFFSLGTRDQDPNVKLMLRDENANTLLLKWDYISDTEAVLYLRYATGEFFDEFWDENEMQRQMDKL